jgi:hypothetical protein
MSWGPCFEGMAEQGYGAASGLHSKAVTLWNFLFLVQTLGKAMQT